MENFWLIDVLWLFFVYSFAGWVLETVLATIRQKTFANRGLINGPFCIIYGFTAVFITIVLNDLSGVWLFFFSMIWATVIEWVSGHLIEKVFKERWWDYSEVKWNLDGYICLPASVLWGVFGYVIVKWGNGFILNVIDFFPELLIKILLLALVALILVDALASYILLTHRGRRLERWESANSKIAQISAKLGKWIVKRVEHRIQKAYPRAHHTEDVAVQKSGTFAEGCGFYKIVFLFFIGAFLGDVTETIFCRLTAGSWMSRSSVVWGPFSIVWGLAIALATWMLYKYREREDGFLFWVGTFLGGAYEYLCSVFTEIVFGKVFWDYSWMPFNLGGRINLLYCFFWGIAAVVWFKRIYPLFSKLIEKIPVMIGKISTWLLIVFMTCNIIVSCMALVRYSERGSGESAESALQFWLDEHYDDAVMERIYPNAKDAAQ